MHAAVGYNYAGTHISFIKAKNLANFTQCLCIVVFQIFFQERLCHAESMPDAVVLVKERSQQYMPGKPIDTGFRRWLYSTNVMQSS